VRYDVNRDWLEEEDDARYWRRDMWWDQHDSRHWLGGKGADWEDEWACGGDEQYPDRKGGRDSSWGKGKGKGKGKKRRSWGSEGAEGPCARVHVANLPRGITEDEVTQFFRQYGQVLGIQILHARNGSGQACAIIRYAAASSAEKAIEVVDGKREFRPGLGLLAAKRARPNPRWD